MRHLLAFFVLFWATPAAATTYVPVDFGEMAAASTFIVHGRITDVRSEATTDRRTVSTYVTLSVDDSLKGTSGPAVTFRVPGGEVGRYRRVIVGAPRFAPGDEVVLFLRSRGPSIPYVFGLSQGVYRVSRATGSPLVTPPPLVAHGLGVERVVRGDPARRPLALAEFERQVRVALERAR